MEDKDKLDFEITHVNRRYTVGEYESKRYGDNLSVDAYLAHKLKDACKAIDEMRNEIKELKEIVLHEGPWIVDCSYLTKKEVGMLTEPQVAISTSFDDGANILWNGKIKSPENGIIITGSVGPTRATAASSQPEDMTYFRYIYYTGKLEWIEFLSLENKIIKFPGESEEGKEFFYHVFNEGIWIPIQGRKIIDCNLGLDKIIIAD